MLGRMPSRDGGSMLQEHVCLKIIENLNLIPRAKLGGGKRGKMLDRPIQYIIL